MPQNYPSRWLYNQKYIDKASADLLVKCLNGATLTEAVLTVRKAGEDPIDYVEITISPVIVTSVGTGGEGGEDRLTEIVTLTPMLHKQLSRKQ